MKRAFLLSSVGAIAFATAPVAVAAQETAGAEAEEQGAQENNGRINRIVVTAQRRAEDVQDVPISITAYGSDFIEESGVQTIQDIALYAPNFNIATGSSASNQRITIRGVGSVANNAIEPSVGVFIDGVYYPRSGAVLGNLVDLETIEVLRGPQGTLFGRNTPVGALNVTTKGPSFSGLEGHVQGGYGAFNSVLLGGSISAPISDNVAFRVSSQFTDRDGFGENLLTGEDVGERQDFSIRGKLAFEFSDQFSATISADYASVDFGGQTVELINGTESPQFLGTLAALFGPDATNLLTEDPFDQEIYQEHGDTVDDEQWGVSLVAEYEFDSGLTIKSITSYREWEAFNFEQALRLPADVLPRITTFSTETFSQELQLLSPSGQTVEYVAGLFFYDEKYSIDQDFDLGPDFCIPVVAGLAGVPAAQGCLAQQQEAASDGQFDQELQSIAAYGQLTFNVTDTLSLTAGGRYTSDDKTADYTNVINNSLLIALGLRDNDAQLDLDASEFGDTDAFTYFLNASYFVADDVMLFATTSTGFKSGGFNSEGSFPNLTREQRGFAPENTTNYEVGIKSQLFDRTLQLNTTVFRMDIEDYQDRSFDGLSFVTRNAGELRVQGIEMDFVWAPIDQLTFTGGASYLDTEFLEYEEGSPLPGGPVQDLTGESAHFAPDWQASLVADWTDDLGFWDGVEYFLRGEVQHVGEQNVGTSTNLNPQSVQEDYQLFNARIGLRSFGNGWEIGLFGRNLTDKGFCLNIFEQPFGAQLGAVNPATNTTAQRCVVGQPRTYGVELRTEF